MESNDYATRAALARYNAPRDDRAQRATDDAELFALVTYAFTVRRGRVAAIARYWHAS
jgi:hypothetical protein